MNFGSYNINPATQQLPQNMSMLSNGSFITNNTHQIHGYQIPYGNNYPFSQYQLQNQQNSGFNQYNNGNYSQQTSNQVVKRQPKPLVVCDPVNKEAIDLTEISKSKKSQSLLDEKKQYSHNSNTSKIAIITIDSELRISYHQDESVETSLDEHKIDEDDRKDIDQNVDSSIIKDKKDQNENKLSLTTAEDHNNTIIPAIIQVLSDSTNSQEISSPDNTVQEKSRYVNHEINGNDQHRKIYSRIALCEIRNSSLCRKPTLDCKEIELLSNKPNDITNKLSSDYQLECSVGGYKTPYNRSKEEGSQYTYLETTRRQFKSILNKIVPQNLALCFKDIIGIITNIDWNNVRVEECMNCLIEEIFLKAVQEESYSVTYADLCTEINRFEMKNDSKWGFKTELIKRCKLMFETPLQEQLKDIREYWEKRIEESDGKMKALFISDIEEQVKKAKDKFFGNIRFIGELYLHDLLKGSIIEICVNALLSKQNDEDSMLSLCKLLETCGKKFDAFSNEKMNGYISSMIEIAHNEDLHIRIRFRLFDIIDMRNRGWILRQIQAQKIIQPKTLDQVKQDDIDEKRLEASKLSNNSQHHMIRKSNYYSKDLKFKNNQNRNQSLEFNALNMKSDNHFELKPSCRQWKAGSGVKDDEWRISGKRKPYNSTGQNPHQNNKSSPVTSRDESPSKIYISSRFAILEQSDSEYNIDMKPDTLISEEPTLDYQQPSRTDSISTSSTREQSPTNLDLYDDDILDSDGILDRFLDTGLLDVHSWCQLSNVDKTLVQWIDRIMEKNKKIRNMMGDEIAKLVATEKLSMDNLIDGIRTYIEDIEDLKTDIPLIWNFLAEFLERLIINSESDISFFKTIFESQESKIDVVNCLLLCLKYADDRLGHIDICKLLDKCTWTLKDFALIDVNCLQSRGLSFLLGFVIDSFYFDQFKNDLLILLSHSDEEIYEFLTKSFCSDMIQTKQYIYFVSCCIFSHLSHLPEDDIEEYLKGKNLFLLSLLDRRLEFETELLRALDDSIVLSENEGLLTTVIQCLADSILSFEVFVQFIERNQSIQSATRDNTTGRLTVDVIKSIIENP